MTFGGVFGGRRVFVTGHTGFKGAWLSYWLHQLGTEITGYSLEPPTEPSLFALLALGDELHHVVADVRDAERLTAEIAAARPSVVFHLAAQPMVRLAYAMPRETLSTNVMGTVNVLEAVRTCDSVEAVVIVTSDKCYGNLEADRAFREDDAMGGRDPYSASKGCAELVTAAYSASFFSHARAAGVASARAGNVIGGGDWAADRIVPDCVRALVAGEPIVVRNPDAVRPWQHVLEPLSGYLQLVALLLDDRRSHSEPWNFGPTDRDSARPVRWVVDRFIEEWGLGTWISARAGALEPHEEGWLSVDSAKARDRLGWAPVWDTQAAVRHTAAWYREHSHGLTVAQARELVAGQLCVYEGNARAAGLAWAAPS